MVADKVAVASTHAERAVGLLSRSGLEPGEGLWIVPCRGVHTWGMRFTIDVVALNEEGVVVDQVSDLKPWRMRLPRRGYCRRPRAAVGNAGGVGNDARPQDRARDSGSISTRKERPMTPSTATALAPDVIAAADATAAAGDDP